MTYEIVYKNKNFNGQKYLTKKDLESLTECNLLYFLKESSYNTLHDYPCMGASEERLRFSNVRGPFESAPKIKKLEEDENNSEILKLLIPTAKMPVKFEQVSLIKYGTYLDSDSWSHLNLVAKDKINVKKMMEIGTRVLKELRKKYSLQKVPNGDNFSYIASIENSLLEFYLSETYFYPIVKISLFGKGEEPQQILQELKIRELGEQFQDPHHVVIGMKNSEQWGLSHNLSLNGKNISETIQNENVLI